MAIQMKTPLVSLEGLESHFDSDLASDRGQSLVARQTIEQTMERLPKGTRRLAAQLRTTVSSSMLWDVLTDYEKLSTFIPNLARSSLLSRSKNKVRLNQVGSQKIMGLNFSAQVEIELIEDPEKKTLLFKLIKGDFRRFEGAWRITSSPEKATSLLYELTVQGCVGMPVGLIEQRLRDDLTTNLLSVEQEANRRQKLL